MYIFMRRILFRCRIEDVVVKNHGSIKVYLKLSKLVLLNIALWQ